MRARLQVTFVCVAVVMWPAPFAWAQVRSAAASLAIVVTDPSGASVAGARIEITRTDVQPSSPASTVSGADGIASFDALTPGRYAIRAEFPGFDGVNLRDYRVRPGPNRRTVTLPLKKVAEDVTVGRDKQSSALDPGGSAFSTMLSREQIDALPDDPDEMKAVLQAMSPPGATFRIDGFTGGRLPSKSQIRSIRLPRMDNFAAQSHGGMNGAMFVDISTQPGSDPVGGSVNTAFRDDVLNAANPFVPAKGDESVRRGGISIGGAVVPGRSSFSLDAAGGRERDAGSLLAALPDGTDATATSQVTRHSEGGGRFDQAIGASHLLTASFQVTRMERGNLGVGGYNLADRAYAARSNEQTLRVTENGPIGRRLFIDSRLQLQWSRSSVQSLRETPTIRVLDAFTMGGAQQAGDRRSVGLEAASDVDYVRGSHSYRAGAVVESGRYRTTEQSNYLGTFTFSSLDDYQAGRASLFTKRIGDPLVRYTNTQIGAYVQDDYRMRRILLLSVGVRYEGQSTARDWWNLAPRATLTWAPFKSGKTTVRGGWGKFTDWLDADVYEQAQTLDGVRQQEVVVASPAYPDPGTAGTIAPPTRYELDAAFALPETSSWNVGMDQSLAPPARLGATYAERMSSSLLRGRNENPVGPDGRPDPAFRDVIRAVTDASQRTRMLNANLTLTWPRWHRTFVGVNYTLASVRTNTTGAFALPASGGLLAEWGPILPRHRFGANLTTRIRSNLAVNISARGSSGIPYTITSGQDSNGDGQFTDRPEGVARNSARTASQWDIAGRLSYAIGFGGPARRGGGGGGDRIILRGGGGGGLNGGFDGGAEDRRWRVELYLAAQNLTNHHNYTGYSGVVTSPFFGQPTNVLNPRKVEMGARFGF
ncbi:MAG: carboxypeptidase regulatory-like domain-containing protein [Acidobacteriota bacterium]